MPSSIFIMPTVGLFSVYVGVIIDSKKSHMVAENFWRFTSVGVWLVAITLIIGSPAMSYHILEAAAEMPHIISAKVHPNAFESFDIAGFTKRTTEDNPLVILKQGEKWQQVFEIIGPYMIENTQVPWLCKRTGKRIGGTPLLSCATYRTAGKADTLVFIGNP